MNQVQANFQTVQQNSVIATQSQSIACPAPRIEHCEFERLLERAMEILSARAKSATASHA